MPEGKKAAVPAPKPVREEDLYSAKTHLHQPVQVQETATVSATAQLADAPEGALPSEVRPEIVTWEKLCEAIKASGRSYNMEMIEKAYDLANTAHKGVCRRSGEPYICHPLAVARLVLDLGMDSESIAAALLHDVVEDTPTTLDDLKAAFGLVSRRCAHWCLHGLLHGKRSCRADDRPFLLRGLSACALHRFPIRFARVCRNQIGESVQRVRQIMFAVCPWANAPVQTASTFSYSFVMPCIAFIWAT